MGQKGGTYVVHVESTYVGCRTGLRMWGGACEGVRTRGGAAGGSTLLRSATSLQLLQLRVESLEVTVLQVMDRVPQLGCGGGREVVISPTGHSTQL